MFNLQRHPVKINVEKNILTKRYAGVSWAEPGGGGGGGQRVWTPWIITDCYVNLRNADTDPLRGNWTPWVLLLLEGGPTTPLCEID